MSAINRLISLFILLLALILGAWFGWDNQSPVALHFYGFDLPPIASGVAILVSLAVGIVAGLAASQIGLYRLRIKNRQLQKQLKRATSYPVSGD